jgi:hypothetical protein
MRKLCIGLLGILACAVSANADGFSESDRSLIAGKDNPFPPDESVLPEADNSTNSNNGNDSSSEDQSKKSEKEYVPEAQDDDDT